MKYKRNVLKNGMRVITVHMKDTPTVTVLAMVEAGSKYEPKNINGISHFLEHMVFKGTEKRPTALAISKELDSLGSHYNAFTSEEYTGYYAKAAPKHVGTLLDVVSDLYLNPVFDDKELQKEKGVIIEEINMYKDLPHRHVQEIFMELMYGDQPAGWTITGPRENIQKMTRDDFVNYRAKHYVAEATTVIVAGNFDQKNVEKQIVEKFGTILKTKKQKKVKTVDTQTEPKVLVDVRKTDQAHLVLGVRGFKAGSKENPTVRMLNAVLGAGMSSRLFQKLREEMGVGYYVRSSYDTYTDHGIFSVSIGADVSRVEEVVKAIIVELKRFTTELVSKEELLKTQEYIIGMMLLGLESSDSIAEFYGYQEVMRQPLKMPNDLIKEIRKVTAEDIRKMAKRIFVTKNLNLAMIGPAVDEKKLKELLTF
jgi:predicted Zn-dependent peptidase